jgi:uncharacterized protein
MRHRWLLVLLAAALVALVLDGMRAAPTRASTHLAVGAIHLYQATLSRLYTRIGVQCRFVPSCSHYAEATVATFGAWTGGWMAAKRILRCGPWTPAGTVDPPPAAVRTADARPR